MQQTKNTISKQLAEIIRDHFPKDIASQVRAAIREGKEWEESPECVNDWSSAAVECGDNDCKVSWHLYHHEIGFSVVEGILYCDLWSIDSDGDWDRSDSVDMASEEYKGWVDRIVAEDEASWIEYAKHVARTGEDPIGNYMITTTKKVKWQFVIVKTKSGLVLAKLRRVGGDWMKLKDAPEALRNYFHAGDLKTFASLADLKSRAGQHASGNDIRWMRDPGKISIMGVREFEEPLLDATIRRKLVAAAKKHLRKKR